MSVKPCRSCGAPVATNAKGCPQCGEQHPHGQAALIAVLWLILFIGVCCAISMGGA